MGGAKNCPETPRQKMIGMMYLVLTAMLALNVSADILNGFNKIRHSMESSILSTDKRTEELMKIFAGACNEDGGKDKYGEWFKIAQDNQQMCDEFYDYLEHFKLEIVAMIEGEPVTEMPDEVEGGDTNKPHQYAINEKDPQTGRTHAEELRERMEHFRQYMTTADSECLQKKMKDELFRREWEQKVEMYNSLFSTASVTDQEGRTIAWEQSIFEEMPSGAVYAMLTKYQNDVRMAENDFLNFLFKSAGSSDFVINSVQALVLPENGEYIMQGGHYRAKIVSAAVDTTNLPRVFINGQEYPDGKYEVAGTSVGPHTYSGYMLMPGDSTQYKFTGQYTVGAPAASISNTNLNVIYSTYPHKFSISVPGVDNDNLKVSATGATISRNGNGYSVTTSLTSGTATITVFAEIDGKMVKMGEQPFRILPMPKAMVYVSDKSGQLYDGNDALPLSLFRTGEPRLVASYGSDGLLEAEFEVVSFSILAGGRIYNSQTPNFTADMKSAILNLRAKETFAVMNIQYKGKNGIGGGSQKASTIALTIK